MSAKEISEEKRLKQLVVKLQKQRSTLRELGVSLKDINILKDIGYEVQRQNTGKGRIYFIIPLVENPSLFISGRTQKAELESWVEISDIHAGSKAFDEEGLRICLEKAKKERIKDIHISGDLFDGINVYPGHLYNLKYVTEDDQIESLFQVFRDFPYFRYRASKGNHDFSFEKRGGMNPVQVLESRLVSEGIDFMSLNGMVADFVIRGVVKRMVHLAGGRAYAKSYPSQVYIRNLLDANGPFIKIKGRKYPLRFLQCGHLHFEVSFETAGVRVTHPGNFQFPTDFTTRKGLVGPQGCRFTQTLIKDGEILEYTSKWVTARS